MELNGKTITIDFEKFSTRGPQFQVLEQVSGGSLNDVSTSYSEIRTYIGSVAGHPGAIACAVYRDGGRAVEANVIFESGYQWFDQAGIVTDYAPVDTLVIPNFPTFQLRAGGAGTTIYSADIGIDVAYSVVDAAGGSTAAAVEMAEFSLMVNNLPFIRDLSAINRLRRLVIRTDAASDPYANGGANVFNKAPWNTNLVEDLLALASQDIGTPTAIGALGDMGLSLQPSEAGGEFGGTMRHEVGHNWGMGHQDGGQPEGKTISSGNELAKFSGPAIENMCKLRDSKLALLDNLGAFISPNFPPRAADDIFIYEPSSDSLLVFDVLSNDRDVNGSSISILNFDSQTQNGIPISQAGNTLTIPNPTVYSSNPDRFKYRIQDATGKTSTAYVNIRAEIPNENIGQWTFGGSKNRILDSGSKANTGRLYGNAHINGSDELVLDGNIDFAMFEPLGIVSNSITFSGFINSNANQVPETGIIIGSDRYGIKIDENNELNFVWSEMVFYPDPSIIVSNNTWTFIALVISPSTSTLYMQPSGGAMQSYVVTISNPMIDFVDQIRLGDGGGADLDVNPPYLPYFNGRMDDFRIINRSLSAAEIALLSEKKLGARDPSPYHTESVATSSISINWTPSPSANGQKLYISSDYSEVKNGSAASEQVGITSTTNTFTLSNASGAYFWRVETTESDNSINEGSIWNFYSGSKNHSGSCRGLLTTCFSVEAPTGMASNGTEIFTTGTTGPLEANWIFQQKNSSNCGIPSQCITQNSYGGNNSTSGLAFISGMIVSASSSGLTAYNHSGSTPCMEVWSLVGEYKGLTTVGSRLFVSEGAEIHELNPTTGAIITSSNITNVQSVQRITAGPTGLIYFTHFQNGTAGGVGVYNINTNMSSLLPNSAGTGLKKPTGLTVDVNGNILVAETENRRIASIDPNTGIVTTYVNGFVAPTDVLFIGTNLYISDAGSNEVRSITCDMTTAHVDLRIDNDCIQLYPNPTFGHFTIGGDGQNYNIKILSSNGNVFQDLTNQTLPIDIDLSTLVPAGLYSVRVEHTNNNKLCLQQIIKM